MNTHSTTPNPAPFLTVIGSSGAIATLLIFSLCQASVGQTEDRLSKVLEAAKSAIAVDEKRSDDPLREMQSAAMKTQAASWGHWGNQPKKFSTWTNHSNRLVPLYTFGMDLDPCREKGSLYSDPERLKSLFGTVPSASVNPNATYHDQVDVYALQRAAVEQGKKHIIVMIFDGMDWQTSRAAALYKNHANLYDSGRGRGLAFLDYRGVNTDFTFLATTPRLGGAKPDVNSQTISGGDKDTTGGFSPEHAGPMPWHENSRRGYSLGQDKLTPHAVTDSAASATSLLTGIKTYNGSINVDCEGNQVTPIARDLQAEGFRAGAVTSVPVSHATVAAAYANNVSRKDYQDIARDMIGLPSSAHRTQSLPGLDVLIGGGWGEGAGEDKTQGDNFAAGNPFLHQADVEAVDVNSKKKTGKQYQRYVVAQRTKGRPGSEVLEEGVQQAISNGHRLLGFFGTKGGHLPFRTADGNFDPTFDVKGTERYTEDDVRENPTLADMTTAALQVLSAPKNQESSEQVRSRTNGHRHNASDDSPSPFWLLVEAGDVDWANHANNIDNSIGAVLSGEAAFEAIVDWVEQHDAWKDTVLFVTSDHGHFLVLDDPDQIAGANGSID